MRLLNKFKDRVWPERMPKALCNVNGFQVELEKKDGALLKSGGEDASADHYYEVRVHVTGENPEYPAREEPLKYRFTVGKPGCGLGMTGSVMFCSAGHRWNRFELVEEFEDPRITRPMGKQMPPHHNVMVRGYYHDEEGRESSMAVGGLVRKSELETPQWKAAERSSTMWL